MLVKLCIFCRDGRGDEDGRYFVERYISAAPGSRIENLVQRVAVAVQNARRLKLGGAVLQIFYTGECTRDGIVGKQKRGPAENR